MATVIENDNCRYEVVKVLNPDGQVLNVSISSGSPSTNPPSVSNDAFGRLRVSDPFTLFDSSHRYADNGLWSQSVASSGSSAFNSNEGCIDMTVTTASGSEVVRETNKVFAYQPGKSLLVMNTFVFNPGKTGLRQRVGYFNTANGLFLELNGTTLSFVKRSSVTGSVVETAVTRTNWNVDKLDGSGPSGITLDITTAQIFWMDLEWLGVGNVRMGFVYNGQFVHCHTFQHANIATTTYITTACLPLRYEITNTASTVSSSTLKQICSTILSEGGYELRGRSRSTNTPITSPYALTTAGTAYPVLSIRLLSTRLDAIVVPTNISIIGLNNAASYNYRLFVGGTVAGGTWSAFGGGSPVETNLTGTSISGGTLVQSGLLSGASHGGAPISLDNNLFRRQLERNGLTNTATELTLALIADNNNSNALVAAEWDEVVY